MDKKTSILFLINNLGIGGAERVFVDDANSLHADGYNIFVGILYGGKDKSPLIHDLKMPEEKIIFLKSKGLFDLSAYLKLRVFIGSNKISILYSTLHDAVFFSRVLSLSIFRLKLITREANVTEKKTLLHKFADQIMNVRVNKMVAVSEEVKKSLIRYQPWFKSKVEVLHNGVDVSREEFSINRNKVILSVGSLTHKKSHDVLLEAFSLIVDDYPDYVIKIVGEGALRGALEEKMKELNLDGRVFFVGNLPHNNVCDLYKNSSVFVLSSDQEGSPNALLEAMSYGLPCIGTNIGAVLEIIQDGISGLIVPKRDPELLSEAIRKLLSSIELRVSIGEAGRDRIEKNFSHSSHISRLKEILK